LSAIYRLSSRSLHDDEFQFRTKDCAVLVDKRKQLPWGCDEYVKANTATHVRLDLPPSFAQLVDATAKILDPPARGKPVIVSPVAVARTHQQLMPSIPATL
jgi:hypothetical protein